MKIMKVANSTYETTSSKKDQELKLDIKINIGTILRYKPDSNSYKTYSYGVLYFVGKDKIDGYVVDSDGEVQELSLERIENLAQYEQNHPSNALSQIMKNLKGTIT
jgi:hypothetical protein